MNKKDVLELKKRFKKESCTFTRLCGCYVNADKSSIVDLNETFLNLEDEELFKYLEIAKKTLSGSLGNNLLDLEFPLAEEEAGGKQQFLLGLRNSKLKNPELLNRFYELVIENYDYVGNFLILLYHDAYDVITRTTDNSALDESEEVYEYLLCAICPVTLTKPGLGYREDENRIAPRIRDWVVGAPDIGFLFPAFTDRSCDIHSTLFYTRNPKEPHPEFMEHALSCPVKRTATEQKEVFHNILKQAIAVGEEEGKGSELLLEIQENLNTMIEIHEETTEKDSTPILLTQNTISELISESKVPEKAAVKIEEFYAKEFADAPPLASDLIDAKAIAANAQKRKEQELRLEVAHLKQQLEDHKSNASIEEESALNDSSDVVLKVNPEKVDQISAQIIDGQKCIIIPLLEDEQATINGVTTSL